MFVCPYVMLYSIAYKSGQFSCPSVHMFSPTVDLRGSALPSAAKRKSNYRFKQNMAITSAQNLSVCDQWAFAAKAACSGRSTFNSAA